MPYPSVSKTVHPEGDGPIAPHEITYDEFPTVDANHQS